MERSPVYLSHGGVVSENVAIQTLKHRFMSNSQLYCSKIMKNKKKKRKMYLKEMVNIFSCYDVHLTLLYFIPAHFEFTAFFTARTSFYFTAQNHMFTLKETKGEITG
jgi:hypothetical protein